MTIRNVSNRMIMINLPERSVALQPFQSSDASGPTDCVTLSESEMAHYEVKQNLFAGDLAIVESQAPKPVEPPQRGRQKVESSNG